ncbi:hypothetical protein [Rubrivivax rivuli]|uniref:Uncharacterized protein n=1 Tax=Rubrivivax rivuli TaxID=1862385 RepID=A0A437RI69_9BURK|nr:hypothetical protein [Rubrivivax rivuli]RVU46441.1 hypothetical protein EOE66_11480 [Rubrivivax rivuli]
MGIHQIQLRYEATADRLLLQVRSTQAEIYAAWLTRRLVSRLLPPFRQAVTASSLQTVAPHALPVPEARQMLEQAALQRPLPGTQFNQLFQVDEQCRHPLGSEPLLADAGELRRGPGDELHLVLQETRGRQIDLGLTPELATALLRLMDGALAAADWALAADATSAAPVADEPTSPGLAPAGRPLN